jgi:hypothetical protein
MIIPLTRPFMMLAVRVRVDLVGVEVGGLMRITEIRVTVTIKNIIPTIVRVFWVIMEANYK